MSAVAPLIAVVDDEESVRRALGRLLVSWGFEVDQFESGLEFLESLAVRRPVCVVLDLHMPKFDGLAVLARLAGQEPIPVIILTGRDTPEAREEARRFGVAAYLRKPVDGEELLEAIRSSMNAPHLR